jgi:hypothetical protein
MAVEPRPVVDEIRRVGDGDVRRILDSAQHIAQNRLRRRYVVEHRIDGAQGQRLAVAVGEDEPGRGPQEARGEDPAGPAPAADIHELQRAMSR